MPWDPYLDLESGVLRNLLVITDAARLRRAEADFTGVRIAQLTRNPIPGDSAPSARSSGNSPSTRATRSIGRGIDAVENAAASKAAHEGNNDPLHAMLDRLVQRR